MLGISEQDVNDIYTIKLTLDGLAARLAAERITPEELTDLEETVNLTEFYVNKDDINKVLELDSRFHDIICRAGKNRPLRSMMSNFHNFLKMAPDPQVSQQSGTSHAHAGGAPQAAGRHRVGRRRAGQPPGR